MRRLIAGIAAAVVVLALAWAFRWETVQPPTCLCFYRVDRWTGDVVFIDRDQEIEVPGPGFAQSTRR
jgi:hypothetical protein